MDIYSCLNHLSTERKFSGTWNTYRSDFTSKIQMGIYMDTIRNGYWQKSPPSFGIKFVSDQTLSDRNLQSDMFTWNMFLLMENKTVPITYPCGMLKERGAVVEQKSIFHLFRLKSYQVRYSFSFFWRCLIFKMKFLFVLFLCVLQLSLSSWLTTVQPEFLHCGTIEYLNSILLHTLSSYNSVAFTNITVRTLLCYTFLSYKKHSSLDYKLLFLNFLVLV